MASKARGGNGREKDESGGVLLHALKTSLDSTTNWNYKRLMKAHTYSVLPATQLLFWLYMPTTATNKDAAR